MDDIDDVASDISDTLRDDNVHDKIDDIINKQVKRSFAFLSKM